MVFQLEHMRTVYTYFQGLKNNTKLFFVLSFFGSFSAFAQNTNCGFGPGEGCANTDYENAFMNSNNTAATIEYDNFVSTYHNTMTRDFQGGIRLWGEAIGNNGIDNILSPIFLNTTNYPALGSAQVFKVTGASRGSSNSQRVALASDGLYAWGIEGLLLDNVITSSSTFQKLTIRR